MPEDKEFFDFGEAPEDEPIMGEPDKVYPKQFESDLLTKNIKIIPLCNLGTLRIMKFRCEAREDYVAGSTFSLCKLPASQIRILGQLSNISASEGMEFTLGWPKYRDRSRQFREANFSGLDEMMDNPLHTFMLDSMEGVFVVATVANEGLKGDYIEGYFIYVKM